MSYPANILIYDETRIVKNKAWPVGNIPILARVTTQLLAILIHPTGAPHGPCGVVAALGNGGTIAGGLRLATEPVERVINQDICGTGH